MTNLQLKQIKLVLLLTGLLALSACSIGKNVTSQPVIENQLQQATFDAGSQIGQSTASRCSNLSSLSTIKNGDINCVQAELDAINPPDSI